MTATSRVTYRPDTPACRSVLRVTEVIFKFRLVYLGRFRDGSRCLRRSGQKLTGLSLLEHLQPRLKGRRRGESLPSKSASRRSCRKRRSLVYPPFGIEQQHAMTQFKSEAVLLQCCEPLPACMFYSSERERERLRIPAQQALCEFDGKNGEKGLSERRALRDPYVGGGRDATPSTFWCYPLPLEGGGARWMF